MKYDFLIVGCGLYGSVFAREMTDKGYSCLIIDKRDHPFGNCYTKKQEGINVHVYGPHIFHTNNEDIWNYVNKYIKFNNYINRPKVFYNDKIYSFPINLFTLYQIWNVKTPQEAKARIDKERLDIKNPTNLEEWILSQLGEEIYRIFFYGYTLKQWNKHPSELPSDIIKRLPIRLNYDDNYFLDKYQGIPIGGYTEMLSNITDGIDIILNQDYFNNQDYWNNKAKNILYTGHIDKYFNYEFGKLEYRSLKFEHQILEYNDYQGNAIINYTDESVPFTRIIEHKHFEFNNSEKTIITKEYPQNFSENNDPYYPINNDLNNHIYSKYKNLSKNLHNVYFGGRLAEYKYYDMHQVIAAALKLSNKITCSIKN